MRTEWRGWFVAVVVAAGCGSSGPASGPKPEMLISGGCPVFLSVDATSLLWLDRCAAVVPGNGTVRQGPKDPTVDAGVATLGQGYQPVSVGGVVYSTVMSDLTTASLQRYDDGSGAQTTITSFPAITAFLAADDSNAYLTLGSSPPEVVAQPLAGGAATTLAGGLPGSPHMVVVDGTDVYWVSELGDGSTQPTSPTGSLSSTTTDGASVSVLVAGFFRPLGLAADATNVYLASDQWVDPVTFQPTDEQLLAVSRTTGEVTTLAVTHGASAVATDGVRVYWTEELPPAVKAIPIAGGAIATLWSTSLSPYSPNSIAVDDTYVYWSLWRSDGTGSIVRLVKPSPN